MCNVPRILIAGTGSGCGKTTMTCALLGALKQSGKCPISFKCGPDYIDPMFHTKVLGTPSYNLDFYLCGVQTEKLFVARAVQGDMAVVEGVMGLYDGLGFSDDRYSANDVAKRLQIPTLLCLDVKGKSLSLLAELSGYLRFKENYICGILLNRCPSGMYPVYQKMIEEAFPVRVYGYLPPLPKAVIGSRHLGLITANEISDIQEKMKLLTETASETLDLTGIVNLSCQAEKLDREKERKLSQTNSLVRIAVAKDDAFCFYYEDALRAVEEAGAELVFFSPLQEQALPEEIHALWLGGGYPEEHLAALSENRSMRDDLGRKIQNGLPTYAECGGFLYLGTSMKKDGKVFPLVGAVKADFEMTHRLVRFGYATLTSKTDNLLCRVGEQIPCHEFHYSDSNANGSAFEACKANGKTWSCIHATDTLFVGYPHLHFGGHPMLAERLVQAAVQYRNKETR